MEFLPGLPEPLAYDFVAYKGIENDSHPYGACYHDLGDKRSTGLIEFLRDRNVTAVIVGGLATNYCVATTARQLKKAGFRVMLNLAACRGIDIPEGAVDKCVEELFTQGIEIIANVKELTAI